MPLEYPAPPIGNTVDDYHGEKVDDPYRELEDPDSTATIAWVGAQRELTEEFLDGLPARDAIRSRLAELWDFPRLGVPLERGGQWFQLRNPGLANQPALHVMSSPTDRGRVLLDPNELSEDGSVSLTGFEVTADGTLLAYATSVSGSDWRVWRVREVATGKDRADTVEWSKNSSAAWLRDGSGFYYTAFPAPEPGAELVAESRFPKVLFHRLGDSAEDDQLLFEAAEEPEWLFDVGVTDDGRFVFVTIEPDTWPKTGLRVLDLEDPERGLVPLVGDFESRTSVAGNAGRTFYLVTDYLADRQRVVAASLDQLGRENWREVVPEAPETLDWASICGGRLVCHYLADASSRLRIHELDGTYLRDIPIPRCSSLSTGPLEHASLEGRAGSALVHFKVTSFTESGAIWSHDVRSGATEVVVPSTAPVEPAKFVTQQVFVASADGARVPMFVSHLAEVVPGSVAPVQLYGYGGFGIPISPWFSEEVAVWMERGGVFASACLRGGGEYGQAWHDAGRLAHKQAVFDDFSACARWLEASGWAAPGRVAIRGGSNGGLLVGACITQHPELFGAAVADVGVFDMLRFPLFTVGWEWKSDFGDPADPDQYRWLRAYSPLHNIEQGANFPATMLVTGDHDDRVVPGHSLKFAAALQQAQAAEAPVLLRVERSTGHGLGKPTEKSIAERADVICFLEAALARER